MPSSDTGAQQSPFNLVMRGYDRDQVNNHFRRYDAEIRVLGADRDAASAHARELADLLNDAQDEIDSLRIEVDRLSVPPTSAEGMGDRISRMLRLASDEASEMRANAEAEAAETYSIADQYAASTRAEADGLREDVRDRQTAMEREHQETMAAAHSEAQRIVAAARADAELLAANAQANRERVQEDFDLAMATRRDESVRTLTEVEQTSKAEAADRVAAATAFAQRTVDLANNAAEQAIEAANAKTAAQVAQERALTDELRSLRQQILTQLTDVHQQLATMPDRLTEIGTEAHVDATRIEPAAFEPINPPAFASPAPTDEDSDRDLVPAHLENGTAEAS